MPPAEAARIRRDFGAISATKKPFAGLENVNLHKSGRRVVLETSGVPIIDEQGGFRGFRGIDRDVTARKKLEEELKRARNELEKKVKRNTLEIAAKQNVLQQEIITRKQIQAELACSEHQFQSLVESLNEGFGIVDAEGRLTYVNAKFLDMLGYVRSEIVGEKIGDFMDERNRRLHQKQLAMRQQDLFPHMVIQMTAIGEESGALDEMLGKVADFYEEEVDNAVDSLSSLLEPLIMVVIGGLVGSLVIAMYLPIFKLAAVV